MKSILSALACFITCLAGGCQTTAPAPAKPVDAKCICAEKMTGCKCAHCKEVKAGKAPTTPCECKPGGGGG